MAISLTESYLKYADRSSAEDGMYWSLGSAPYKPITDEFRTPAEAFALDLTSVEVPTYECTERLGNQATKAAQVAVEEV